MIAPTRPLLPREARSARVAACLENVAFTGLLAPPGYGKTTLFALATERVAAPTVRYTVELWHAGDFVEPLVEAIARERPDFGRRTRALARRKPRDSAALATWGRRLGATFSEDLDHIRESIVIAIDDAHVLADDPVFANFIAGALRVLPPHAHFAMLGRSFPSLPFAEWIAAGRAHVFTVDDIRFDDDDVRTLAAKLGSDLRESDLAKLMTLYEGWAAGIALAFASGEGAVPSRGGSLSARSAYLLDANLDSLQEDLARFIERTAVFETLDASLLETEPDFARSRAHLAELERRGMMLEVVRPGELYRVHPLLREALVQRAKRRGPQELPASHLRAARALENAGRIREALYHFEACGDEVGLARFIGAHAYDLFIVGQGERIARISKRLERAGADATATFALIDGMIARQRGEPGAEESFLRGIAAADLGDREGIACRMLLIEDRLARREVVEPEIFAGWAQAVAGSFEEARAHARRAAAIAGDDVVGLTRAASLEAYAATALGAIADADAIMAKALRELEASEQVVLFANTLVWYARFALLWNDVPAARDYAERGRALARELDLPAELAGIELALAEVYARSGDRARCETACKNAIRESAAAWYAGDRKRSVALATIFRARGAFAANDVTGALDSARTAFDDMRTTLPAAQRAALAADIAAYALVANDSDRAGAWELAVSLLRAATATDALDAAQLSDAAAVLETIAKRGDMSLSIEPSANVRASFGDYIAARRATAASDPLVLALGPARRASVRDKSPRNSALTPREEEILHLIVQGLTNREIAQRFTLSPRTVDTHVERVLSKLGTNSRTRAVATAIRLGLVGTT